MALSENTKNQIQGTKTALLFAFGWGAVVGLVLFVSIGPGSLVNKIFGGIVGGGGAGVVMAILFHVPPFYYIPRFLGAAGRVASGPEQGFGPRGCLGLALLPVVLMLYIPYFAYAWPGIKIARMMGMVRLIGIDPEPTR